MFFLDPVIKALRLRVSTLMTSNEYLLFTEKQKNLTDETIFRSCISHHHSDIFSVMKCNLKGQYDEIFSTSDFQQLHAR
jgi:hypothetical protein